MPWWPCPVAVVAAGVEGGPRDRPPSAGHWPDFRDHRHRLVCVGIVARDPNRRVRRCAAQGGRPAVGRTTRASRAGSLGRAFPGGDRNRCREGRRRTRYHAAGSPLDRGLGAGTAAADQGQCRPGPGASPERVALVRHLHRGVSRHLRLPEPGRRAAEHAGQVPVPSRARHLRRLHHSGERRGRAARRRPDQRSGNHRRRRAERHASPST